MVAGTSPRVLYRILQVRDAGHHLHGYQRQPGVNPGIEMDPSSFCNFTRAV